MEDEENVDRISDETIQFLGKDGRSVYLHNKMDGTHGRFIAVEGILETGEDLFLMIGVLDEYREAFQPVLDQILASFNFAE